MPLIGSAKRYSKVSVAASLSGRRATDHFEFVATFGALRRRKGNRDAAPETSLFTVSQIGARPG
jgi:hypothetical protein